LSGYTFFHLLEGTAETRAVLVDGCEGTVLGRAGAGQEYSADLIFGDSRFTLGIADHESLRRRIEPADLPIHSGGIRFRVGVKGMAYRS